MPAPGTNTASSEGCKVSGRPAGVKNSMTGFREGFHCFLAHSQGWSSDLEAMHAIG